MITYVLVVALMILYALGSMLPGVANERLKAELVRQLGPFEHLETRVETDPPIRALTGQIDTLQILANGFSIQGLPVATAAIATAPFSLDMGSLFGGHPRLLRPLEATASMVLSEAGLNALLRSPQITRQLRGIPAQLSLMPGFPAIERRVDIFPGRLRVIAGGLSLVGTADFGGGALVPFAATASPHLEAPNLLVIDGLQASVMGSPLPPSLLAKVKRTLDLGTLPTGSASIRIQELALSPGQVRIGAQLSLPQLEP